MRRTPQAASVPRPGALEALSSSAGSSAGSEGQRERLGMISEDFFRWQRSAPILSRIGAQTACVARARSGHRERGACRDLPERELVEVPTREVPSRYRTDFGDPEVCLVSGSGPCRQHSRREPPGMDAAVASRSWLPRPTATRDRGGAQGRPFPLRRIESDTRQRRLPERKGRMQNAGALLQV
ncbi:unnamed protein product [Lampetra planeri]